MVASVCVKTLFPKFGLDVCVNVTRGHSNWETISKRGEVLHVFLPARGVWISTNTKRSGVKALSCSAPKEDPILLSAHAGGCSMRWQLHNFTVRPLFAMQPQHLRYTSQFQREFSSSIPWARQRRRRSTQEPRSIQSALIRLMAALCGFNLLAGVSPVSSSEMIAHL